MAKRKSTRHAFVPAIPAIERVIAPTAWSTVESALRIAEAAFDSAPYDEDGTIPRHVGEDLERAADALFSTPAPDGRALALKIEHFACPMITKGRLSDPAERQRIATKGTEDEKRVLTMYLDAIAIDRAPRRTTPTSDGPMMAKLAERNRLVDAINAPGSGLNTETGDGARMFDENWRLADEILNTTARDLDAVRAKLALVFRADRVEGMMIQWETVVSAIGDALAFLDALAEGNASPSAPGSFLTLDVIAQRYFDAHAEYEKLTVKADHIASGRAPSAVTLAHVDTAREALSDAWTALAGYQARSVPEMIRKAGYCADERFMERAEKEELPAILTNFAIPATVINDGGQRTREIATFAALVRDLHALTESESGPHLSDDEVDAAVERTGVVARKIMAERASTPQGLQAKVQAVAWAASAPGDVTAAADSFRQWQSTSFLYVADLLEQLHAFGGDA